MKMPRTPPSMDELMSSVEYVTELGMYFQRQDVKDFVHHVNELYLHWDEMNYRPKPPNTNYNMLWAMVKSIRGFGQKVIEISDVEGFTFSYSLTDQMSQQLHEFDMNLGGSITGESILHDEEKDKYLISSLMEEAIASSQIEGAATTRKVAKEMLREGRKPRNRSEKMIINNYRSIKMLLSLKDEELTPQILLDIQSSMTKDTLDDVNDEGKFRESNDVVVKDSSN
jgi:Fic family protein